MAMTESVHVSARRAPFGAITIFKFVDAISNAFATSRAADMRQMSPAIREDLGVTLADLDAGKPSTFARVAGFVRDWNMRRRTVAELSLLSDRQLEDIGLNRADIHNI